MFRYVLAWVAMAAIAIANGALREATFGKALPELAAHQVSTLIGSIAMGVFIGFVVRFWPPASDAQAWAIGVLWLGLTLVFEFAMGLVVMKKTWAQALADYDVRKGRVWPLFLVWITIAPWLFHRWSA